MKLIRLISAVVFAIFIAGCTEKETQVEVSSVSLNTATIEMVEGETFSLVATVLPKDAEYDGVIWASSNASVASVNSGTVTAIKEGTATITASAGGKSSTCAVKVSAKVVAVTSIILDKTSLSLKVGETETITATVNPDNATDKSVTWGSSDVSVATVSDGKVTAKKSGTAIITAKSGSCIAECIVAVSVDVESITLDKTSLELTIDETVQLTATVKPDNATDKNVTWTSSDESVAKVDNGRVTAVKAGKAMITAKCGDKTAECAVTVTVPITSLTLDKTTLPLSVGETAQLTATVKPDNATDKNVTWTSSDESVAKVDNGKVTAVKAGNATITAKCGDKTAECAVTVTVPITSLTLDKTTLSLSVGETAQLTATVKPDDATDKNVTWSSSNESIVTVSNGEVYAVAEGSAVISVASGDNRAQCDVTVSVPNNIIYYTSSDQNIITPYNTGAFGSNIIANKYEHGLGRIVFDGPVTKIGKAAFYQCKTLLTIQLPSTITIIDNNSFNECLSLKSIAIPNGVTTIGDKAFHWCLRLSSVSIPNSVMSIGSEAFRYSDLMSIKLPETLQSIGAYCFGNCSIKDLAIPDSVTSIGDSAFQYCGSLNNIVLGRGVTAIPRMCFESSAVSEISIPEGYTSIGYYAFNRSLNLSTVYLPSTITVIGKSAFTGSSNFKSVYIKAVTPPQIFDQSFSINVREDLCIYVPRASVDAYKSQWSDYKDYIQGYDF